MGDNFLKEIGRSYIVSSFLPAAFFVSIGFFLFHGFIPLGIVKQISATGTVVQYQWLVSFLLVGWTAFYLYSANDITVRLFEGYFPPFSVKRKSKSQISQEEWTAENLPVYSEWKQKQNQFIRDNVISEDNVEKLINNALKALTEIFNVNLKKPLNPALMMPTRLGNVFRSSETYAFERYYIIDTAIWPRLLPTLPPEITKHLEEKNNLFMFLLNSSFLSYLMALLSLFFGVLGIVLQSVSTRWPTILKDFFYIGYDFISPLSYLGLMVVLIGFGYMLYLVAVNAAEDFSMYIRSSFDLYRTNLLRQLNWEPPNTLEKEKGLWLEVSKLLIGGHLFPSNLPEFKHNMNQVDQKSKIEVEISEEG